MNFAPWADSIATFFEMGGHSLYVWLSFGAAFVVVGGNVMATRLAWLRYRREHHRKEGSQDETTSARTLNES